MGCNASIYICIIDFYPPQPAGSARWNAYENDDCSGTFYYLLIIYNGLLLILK